LNLSLWRVSYTDVTQTPSRFHSRPAAMNKPDLPKFELKLTQPSEPTLSTSARASVRTSGVMTREEEEEKEVEEMKKYRFKALPLDPRVLLSCGEMGVPRVDKKPVTLAQAPVFKTDCRAGRRSSVMEEPSFELFKARPCPTFPSRSSTPERAEVKLTMPTSPNLSYRTRPESRSSSASRLREEASFEFKALPVPRGVYEPMVPRTAAKAPTMPEPFKFKTEERSGIARDSSSDSLSCKPYVFKALPVPKAVAAPPSPPRPVARALTEPQPFNLSGVSLAEQAKSRFKIAVDAELAQEQALFSSFKAAPVRISGSPFRPERSKMPLTEVTPFELNTDKRKEDREEFEMKKYERIRTMDVAKEEAERRRREEEERDRRQMRKSMNPSINPVVPDFERSFEVKRSTKSLTTPVSPKFMTDMRARGQTTAR
jgi:targeting protein for Xklp2